MNFDKLEFFNACDDFDAFTTDDLLLYFKMKYVDEFNFDMYDFMVDITVRDIVLMLIFIKRFIK